MSKLKQELSKEKILQALRCVKDKGAEEDVVTAGIISSVIVRGSSVGFAIEVNINDAAEKEILRKECEKAVKLIRGVKKVTAVLTSARPGVLSSEKKTPEHNHMGKNLPDIKNIIVVASGKGGVGKSTVTVNLARSLAKAGKKVGIVDVDIYGPSIPKMLGLSGKPDADEDNRMIPKEKHGVKSISLGYLIETDRAVVWRSAMILKAMTQLLRSVAWGELDYLIVDTPPGTGDIQLSLVQDFNITGVVLVSTPQEVALLDVRKAANMFIKVDVPIIGIVENMSYFEDDSGKKNYIFGKDGAKSFAKEMGITLLGEIPIRQDIREACDSGSDIEDDLVMNNIAVNFETEMEKANGIS